MKQQSAVIKELNEIHYQQQVLAERATELINKLGEVSTSSSSRKGSDVIINNALAKRRSVAFTEKKIPTAETAGTKKSK